MDNNSQVTIPEIIAQWAVEYKDNIAIKFRGISLSYEAFCYRVNKLARGLIEIGIKKGDKVCVWLPNGSNWIIADYAITSIGAILVPMNLRYTAEEMEHVLSLSDVSTIIMMDKYWKEDCLAKFDSICPGRENCEPGNISSEKFPHLKNVICISDNSYPGTYSQTEVMAHGAKFQEDDLLDKFKAAVKPDDVAKIFFTSGTTSFPKGVVLTHNILLNISSQAEILRMSEKDRMAHAVPAFYIMGNLQQVLSSLLVGATIIPIEKMDPTEMLETIHRERCTVFHGIPTLFMALVEHPGLEKYDLTCMRAGGIGGAPFTADLVQDVREKLHIHELYTGYGLTETTAVNLLTRHDDSPETISSTIGKALPGTEIRIVDPETGENLPDNSTGECVIKGHMVMNEYYKRPKETDEVLRDGWFHTEDLMMRREDGYFEFKGRIKDVIRRGGENVSVPEVEGILGEHPKIAQAELIGLPHPRYEEVPMAYVRLSPGESCTEEEVITYCKERLAKYKVPQHVKFVETFPLTATGKVQKFILKEQAIKEMT